MRRAPSPKRERERERDASFPISALHFIYNTLHLLTGKFYDPPRILITFSMSMRTERRPALDPYKCLPYQIVDTHSFGFPPVSTAQYPPGGSCVVKCLVDAWPRPHFCPLLTCRSRAWRPLIRSCRRVLIRLTPFTWLFLGHSTVIHSASLACLLSLITVAAGVIMFIIRQRY